MCPMCPLLKQKCLSQALKVTNGQSPLTKQLLINYSQGYCQMPIPTKHGELAFKYLCHFHRKSREVGVKCVQSAYRRILGFGRKLSYPRLSSCCRPYLRHATAHCAYYYGLCNLRAVCRAGAVVLIQLFMTKPRCTRQASVSVDSNLTGATSQATTSWLCHCQFLPCDCERIRTVLLWTSVRLSVCQTRALR